MSFASILEASTGCANWLCCHIGFLLECRAMARRQTVADIPSLLREWHPERNGDLRADHVSAGDTRAHAWWRCTKDPTHEWRMTVGYRKQLGTSGCPFCAGHRVNGVGSLADLHATLATEWHPTKNGTLRATQVTAGCNTRVWWRCAKDPLHEWQACVQDRAQRGNGCPYCAGHRAAPDTSLAALFPEIADEWHPTKNGELEPSSVRPGSGRKVWWRCSSDPGHEWEARIGPRTERGVGCPYCTNRRAASGRSLAHRHPILAAQWHLSRNGQRSPRNVVPGSPYVAWWQCPVNARHEWRAAVAKRALRGDGCPYCRNKRLAPKPARGGYPANSLAARFPLVAAEWHPTKNLGITAADVLSGAHRKVWWQCRKAEDHVWQAAICHRTRRDVGCPVCAKLGGNPDDALSRRHPELAAQWHPRKNGKLTPRVVHHRSTRVVWWKCPGGRDHVWKSQVLQRTVRKGPCPFCAGVLVSVTNSLTRLFPRVAREWHPERNGREGPGAVPAGARRFAWWRCAVGHVWRMRVADRTVGGRGCPACARSGYVAD